jgi:hypothetical protein
MAHVLTQIAQEQISVLFRQRIAGPIGMDSSSWSWGDYGIVDGYLLNGGGGNGSKGVEITAREMARFGHLFLNRGNWDGNQVLSTGWVDDATQNHVPASIFLFRDINTGPETGHMDIEGRGIYGYHWWVNGITVAGSRSMPDAPLGTFYRSGYNDNFVVVVPEWDIVIVRLGLDETVDDAASLWNDVLKLISEAFISPVLTLLSPNDGEVLNAGETFEITWASEGDIENVKIEYSVNNGTNWIEIDASTENDGFYQWEIPLTPSDECLVKISDVDGDPFDESKSVFAITPPICKADFNDDKIVDKTDLETFSIAMGKADCTLLPDLCDCDIEGDDNDIDGADLAVLAAEFGREDCPAEDYAKLPISSAVGSDYQDEHPPEDTIDGDLSTRWSALGDGQWIEYDLGSTTNVGYVKIAWFNGDQRMATFDIEMSSDGIGWSQVYSGQSSGTTLNLDSYDFNDLTARYLRIVGHGNTENDWNSITEVEVYGR